MVKQDKLYEPVVSFRKQSPEMLIGDERKSEAYETAFFRMDDSELSEYCQNTTTWD